MCFSRVVASSPSFSRHAARTPRRAYSQTTCWMAHDSGARNTKRLHHSKAKLFSFLFKVALRCLPSSKVFLYHETFSGKGYIGVTVLKKKCWDTLNVSRCKLMKMSATLKFTPLPFKSADFQLHKVVLSSELFKQQLATVIRSKT